MIASSAAATMPPQISPLVDLADLKMLPAWVTEPSDREYSAFTGEEEEPARRRSDRRPRIRGRERPPGSSRRRLDAERRSRPPNLRPHVDGSRATRPLPPMTISFLPQPRALESVAAQIKADALAYSLFSLARLFLQKPERYIVGLQTASESPLFQLGEDGPISADRQFLENNAFRFAQHHFYKIDISQTDPIKGNFTSVARDRLSGTLLGPTNHHSYQPRLRTLYEQRFSKRMSFADFQRQIEIVSDPALVEKWKEEARTVTKYTTLREEPPLAFSNVAEAERHFRKTYLPGLLHSIDQTTVDGVTSRQLADRLLRGAVEGAWAAQNRSPSQMMQELATRFRDAGLHVFRHRRGMLFLSPVRPRNFTHESTAVSPQLRAILETVGQSPRIHRKELADKLVGELAGEEAESRKLALASDLRWLISEGYVIEFNDGSLDLPRAKAKNAPAAPAESTSDLELVAAAVSAAEPGEQPLGPSAPTENSD